MAVRRVTKAVVDRLPISGVVWDADVRGFGVRRQQRDASYVLKVRVGTRQRFLTIGRHGAPWTPETARKEARRLLGEVAAGRDPADARAARKRCSDFQRVRRALFVGACSREQKTPFRSRRPAQSSAPYPSSIRTPTDHRDHLRRPGEIPGFQVGYAHRRKSLPRPHVTHVQHGGALGFAPSPVQSMRARRQVSGARAGKNALVGGAGSSRFGARHPQVPAIPVDSTLGSHRSGGSPRRIGAQLPLSSFSSSPVRACRRFSACAGTKSIFSAALPGLATPRRAPKPFI